MDNQKLKLKDTTLKFHQTDRKLNRKDIVTGTVIGTFIAITPILFYLYESVPNGQVWNTFLFTYDSKAWGDANLSMWIFTGKAVPCALLILWFFTNRHWWYHALLVPITMYLYQIIGLFTSDSGLDQFELIYMVPIMALIVPSIYLIRAKMFNTINDADKTMQELEDEFRIKPKGFMNRLKEYF